MKNLSTKELEEAPAKVQYIYMCAMMSNPIGLSTYDDAIKEHPEYFPEEVEHIKKWDSVPQEVHDAYNKEHLELYNEAMKDAVIPSKGIMYWIENYDEFEELNKKWSDAHEKFRPTHEFLNKKYYAKYGVEAKWF